MTNPDRSRSSFAPALLLAVALPASSTAQQGGPRVTSPEVAEGGRTCFRVHAPTARNVLLSGTDIPGNARGTRMTRGGDGVWESCLDPLEPGAYRYHFSVDDVRVLDPVNPATSESNMNAWSLVYVPGADFMGTRDVPRGAVAEVTYYSTSLERFRRMHVYTPPGYEAGEGSYPVLYLLHGAFDSDDSWTSVGRAGFIVDNLIAEGRAEPMVIAMPAGHTGPFWFGMPLPEVNEFVEDFTKDVLPWVESHYRVRTDRASRAIAGLSMGGGQTLDIAVADLERFAYLGVFSAGVFGITGSGPGARDDRPPWLEQHAEALSDAAAREGLELVWFATGKDDFLLETTRATVAALRERGFEVTYEETGGSHTWKNWREYLAEFTPLLFR